MMLIPDLAEIQRTAVSAAERRVAELLKAIDGPEDAVAFHSVRLRSHRYKQQAEADFVILWKGVVLVIEVKGGGVKKFEGVWYSINRRGDWKKLQTSPMEQARSAMYALREIFHQDGLGWFAHEAVVITPEIDSPPASHEWEATHWLAKDDMSASALAEALEKVAADRRSAPPGAKVARARDLREQLFGEFSRMPAIDAQRGAVIEDQNEATKAQARVLASLARNQRLMVLGGAGTGKSLVLAESAKQEAAVGRSVLITFRSPALTTFFSPIIGERAIDVVPFDELPVNKTYDVVLIDEAQDLMTAESMDRLDAVIAGGRGGGRWRMYLDPNNQAHVDGRFDEDVYELVAVDATTIDLDRNVRNTQAIVHVVQEYLGADIGDPGIVHGDKPQWSVTRGSASIPEAAAIARTLIDDGARASSIWIISVTSDSPPAANSDGVVVTSPRHAKGLEAERVIVCDLPEKYDAAALAAFYVAVTRARVSLHIVLSAEDKRRLQELIRNRGAIK